MNHEISKLGKIEFIDIKDKWDLSNALFGSLTIFFFFAILISFFINIFYSIFFFIFLIFFWFIYFVIEKSIQIFQYDSKYGVLLWTKDSDIITNYDFIKNELKNQNYTQKYKKYKSSCHYNLNENEYKEIKKIIENSKNNKMVI